MVAPQLERLSCITSRYTARPPLGGHMPSPLLLAPSLDLDMGVYSRHFNESPPFEMISVAAPLSEDLQQHSPFAGGLMVLDQDKPLVLDLAMTAADHLVRMCNAGAPLWVRKVGNVEVLDLEEHAKGFSWPMELRQPNGGESRTEASRDSAMVIMNSITLVDAFLDAVSRSNLTISCYLTPFSFKNNCNPHIVFRTSGWSFSLRS